MGYVPFERRRGANVNKVETAVRLRYHGKDADTGEPVEFLDEN